MRADFIAGSVTNLESIAQCYTGFAVRVRWMDSPRYKGLAFRTPAHGVIELNGSIDVGEVGEVFFHEVAHLIHDFPDAPDPDGYTEPTGSIHARLETMPDSPERAGLAAIYDNQESRADAWALAALAAFEAQFGPFPVAIVGGHDNIAQLPGSI